MQDIEVESIKNLVCQLRYGDKIVKIIRLRKPNLQSENAILSIEKHDNFYKVIEHRMNEPIILLHVEHTLWYNWVAMFSFLNNEPKQQLHETNMNGFIMNDDEQLVIVSYMESNFDEKKIEGTVPGTNPL